MARTCRSICPPNFGILATPLHMRVVVCNLTCFVQNIFCHIAKHRPVCHVTPQIRERNGLLPSHMSVLPTVLCLYVYFRAAIGRKAYIEKLSVSRVTSPEREKRRDSPKTSLTRNRLRTMTIVVKSSSRRVMLPWERHSRCNSPGTSVLSCL